MSLNKPETQLFDIESEVLNDVAARYGKQNLAQIIANNVVKNLVSHRSVRAFSDSDLPQYTLETMVAAAQSASTSSNLQTWSVVAVTDFERKARLSELAGGQRHIVDAPLFLVWLADLSRLKTTASIRNIEATGTDYLELFLVGCVDASLAAQNAAVAAESLGLGIVYIGGMRNNPIDVAQLLELPDNVFAVFGMCVGNVDPNRPASIKPRLPQSAVLFQETYSKALANAETNNYDGLMEAFYKKEEMLRDAWSIHSANRVKGPERLAGRDKLRSYLKRMGFALK